MKNFLEYSFKKNLISLILSINLVTVGCKLDRLEQETISSSNSLCETIFIYEVFTISTSKNYLILVYSSSCLACLSIIEIINYKEKECYFEIYKIDYNGISLRDEQSNIGINDCTKISINKVPCLFVIENKYIIDEIYGFNNIQIFDFYKFKIG